MRFIPVVLDVMQGSCRTRAGAVLSIFLLLSFAVIASAHQEAAGVTAQGQSMDDGSACTLCAMSALTAVVPHFALPLPDGRISRADDPPSACPAFRSEPEKTSRPPPLPIMD